MSIDLELKRVEYRVKPVTRYIVTRFEAWNLPAGSNCAQSDDKRVSDLGEYANGDQAWEVAYALCKQRHELIGWPLGDERIQYPQHPNQSGPGFNTNTAYNEQGKGAGKTESQAA